MQSVKRLLDSFCCAITTCQMQFGVFVIGRINCSRHWEGGGRGGKEKGKKERKETERKELFLF